MPRSSKIWLVPLVALLSACGGLEGEFEGDESAQSDNILIKTGPNLQIGCLAALGCRISREEGEAAPVQAHLGRGWNEISDTDTPSYFSCLEPFTKSSVALTGIQIESSFELVSSSQTLHDVLNIDGRVSGSAPTEPVPVSGSIGGNILNDATAHQDAINLVVRTKVRFTPQRITSTPRLTAAALSRYDQSGQGAFRNLCGDRFVDEVVPGGEYIAVMQLSSSSSDVQRTLKARINAAIGSASDSAQAVQAAVAEANLPLSLEVGGGVSSESTFQGSNLEVRIHTIQRGGSDLTNATNIAQIINKFAQFPASITSIDHTAVVGVHLANYTAVSNFGTRQVFSMSNSSSAVSLILGPRYLHYHNVYNQLDFALRNRNNDMYFAFNVGAAELLRDQAAEKIVAVEAAVERCASNTRCTTTEMQAEFPSGFAPSSQLPKRKQFYKVLAKTFLDATIDKGAAATFTKDFNVGGSCHIDQDTTAPVPPAGHFRVWTGRGLTGTTCRFRIMDGARLTGLWNVHLMNANIPIGDLQQITHAPEKSDLSLKLVQTSPLASFNPDTTAVVNHFVLVGPEGDPALEPWRNAIRVD